MYIRKSTREYKGRTYTNYLLVESVRTPKGPRQKVICSLGDLRPRRRSEWLRLAHKVESALVGQGDLFGDDDAKVRAIVRKVGERDAALRPAAEEQAAEAGEDLVAVHTDRVRTERHREAGPVYVGCDFWERLGLDGILENAGVSERTRILTCAMTLNRLIAPCSEHAMPDWIRRTALGDLLEVDFEDLAEDALYRNMDRLHSRRAVIEKELAEREETLFNLDPMVFLYDLSSTYFEGSARANPKAKRGYSRDKRPDCTQVVLGLVIRREGFPLAHEVFEGNTQDRASLGPMLDGLDRRVGLKPGQTVVVDRGMAYEDNLQEIRGRGLHYVVASRQTERDQWMAEFEDARDFEEVERVPSPRNPGQKKTEVRVKKVGRGEETHVLCLSDARAEKDRAIREKHEGRLLADLGKLEKRIREGRLVRREKIWEAVGRIRERYPRVARYYRIGYAENEKRLCYELDEERRKKAETLDGSYLLRTDRTDLSADEIWRIYTLLTRIEDAFRSMKSPLSLRPIHHQKELRVETHIFLCILAYHLLVAIEKTLLDQRLHTSWATVRESLRTHQVSTVVLPTDGGTVLRIRRGSTPEPHQVELYDRLGMSSEIIRPKKTWSRDPLKV